MFSVSDSALEYLAESLARVDDPKPDNVAFRVSPNSDGDLTMTIDAPTPDDTEYEHNGKTVLVLADSVCELCENRTLDTDETDKLVLR